MFPIKKTPELTDLVLCRYCTKALPDYGLDEMSCGEVSKVFFSFCGKSVDQAEKISFRGTRKICTASREAASLCLKNRGWKNL